MAVQSGSGSGLVRSNYTKNIKGRGKSMPGIHQFHAGTLINRRSHHPSSFQRDARLPQPCSTGIQGITNIFMGGFWSLQQFSMDKPTSFDLDHPAIDLPFTTFYRTTTPLSFSPVSLPQNNSNPLRLSATETTQDTSTACTEATRQLGAGVDKRDFFFVGSKERGYGHAIVAGVERYPLKITKNMGKKRISKRSKVKPFIKVINYNHMMPTRYGLELENLKSVLTVDSFKEPSQREEAKKAIKKLFEERYNSGKNKWFFSKLRF
ncbi:hypothetical protein BGX29_004084 [Mortierella sp. GBA35]|nr:hypothetical protein BGX29_004084 [Mortierella sp. GBA35]